MSVRGVGSSAGSMGPVESGAPAPSAGPSTRSASVVSCSVRTIEKRTRVHSSFVGHTCPGCVLARAHDRPVGALGDALDRRDRALQCLDDLGHRDLASAGERACSRRAIRGASRPGRPCAVARRGAPGRRAAARRARRSPRAGSVPRRLVAPARPSRARRTRPWWRTSSRQIPTCAARVSTASGASGLLRCVHRSHRRHPSSLRTSCASASGVSCSSWKITRSRPRAIDQEDRRRAVEGSAMPALARDHVKGAPDRSQLRGRAAQIADASTQRRAREEAR